MRLCVFRPVLLFGLACGLLLSLWGCSTLGYYQQAVAGQARLLWARVPVSELLAEPNAKVDERLRHRLQLSQRILSFLQAELHLQPQQRYRSYVELDRSAVVYNLVAAKPLSLEPQRWCYPIAGCAPYRGYFRQAAAQRAAARYQRKGFDTYIGEVPAYSTLGWFDDPLLSTFIHWPTAELVDLLAHETAHSKLWVASDVAFNEAFASFVGGTAARVWLRRGGDEGYPAYLQRQLAWRKLQGLMQQARTQLLAVFASDLSQLAKRQAQSAVYAALRQCHDQHRDQLGGRRFDGYLAKVNNASLAALATYEDFQPAFAALFDQTQGDWPRFYAAARQLGELDKSQRHARLAALAKEPQAGAGDHNNANQIQCKALSNHGLHVKSAGTVDDHVGRGRHG